MVVKKIKTPGGLVDCVHVIYKLRVGGMNVGEKAWLPVAEARKAVASKICEYVPDPKAEEPVKALVSEGAYIKKTKKRGRPRKQKQAEEE